MKALLDFIAWPESRGDYNAYWGGIRSADKPPKPLVQMTIGEVLAWQDSIDRKYMSEAAGRYQILEDTLRGLYKPAGLTASTRFDEAGQDALAVQLLKRRGLEDFLGGKLSAEQFAQNISKEWASMPAITKDKRGRPAAGQSYYAGDGLNKAHVSIDEFLAAVRAVRDEKPEPGTGNWLTGLFAALASIIQSLLGAMKWNR